MKKFLGLGFLVCVVILLLFYSDRETKTKDVDLDNIKVELVNKKKQEVVIEYEDDDSKYRKKVSSKEQAKREKTTQNYGRLNIARKILEYRKKAYELQQKKISSYEKVKSELIAYNIQRSNYIKIQKNEHFKTRFKNQMKSLKKAERSLMVSKAKQEIQKMVRVMKVVQKQNQKMLINRQIKRGESHAN